jgi:EmrB/QacA subfamily drug resistance transporter
MTTTSDRVPEQRDAHAEPVDPHYERRWLILLVVLIAQLMILVDATVINVALPSAQKALHFSNANREWVITGYVLAFGSLLPLGGRMADLWGRKRMFIIGLIGFGVMSSLAGAAPDTATLLVARTLQGVFGAVLAPAALSVIPVTFTDLSERNKAFAIFGAVAGAAGALGLLLGGVLTSYADWRWTMFVNVAFAVVALIGALTLMTNSADPRQPRLDLRGALLASGGLFLLVFGGAKAQTDGWGAGITVGSLVGGAVILVAFIASQRTPSYPLLPLKVIRDRNRAAAYLTLFLNNGATFAAFLFLTYYFQIVHSYSPVRTGFAFVPLPVSIGIAATVTQNQLVKRFQARWIIVAGGLFGALGAVVLAQSTVTASYYSGALPGLILIGLGIGTGGVISISMGTLGVAPEEIGTAGAMNNVAQQVGAALGIAMISTIAATATSHYATHHSALTGLAAHASVHGFNVGFYCSAAVFATAAAVCGSLVRSRTRLSQF